MSQDTPTVVEDKLTPALASMLEEYMERKRGNQTRDQEVTIVREGNTIAIPANMSFHDARKWLERQENFEEKIVSVNQEIKGFPLDCALALARSIQEAYGFTEAKAHGFFGQEVPPTFVNVETPTGVESVMIDEIHIPKWEGGHIEPHPGPMKLVVNGKVKRKWLDEVNAVIDRAKEYVATHSIYRGRAVQVDLSWIKNGGFHFLDHAPQFMNLNSPELILNTKTQGQLDTSVFMLIEKTDACVANGIPLKHGALLQGSFGTGKTMTAKRTAALCEENGWSFLYIREAEHLAEALRMAKLYAPAVVFAEDIDTAVNERDANMNEILNTLDGVDTKDTPIITMLTTNKVDDIDPSFLRAGRIDTLISFEAPDAPAAARFVQIVGANLLADDVDFEKVGDAMKGLVSAFIAEAVAKAKRYAISRTGATEIEGKVSTDDLLRAAEVVHEHVEFMNPASETEEERDLKAVKRVGALLGNPDEKRMTAIETKITELREGLSHAMR